MCCTPARPSGEDLLIQPLIRTCQGPKKELGRVSHFPHRDYGGSPSGWTAVSTLPLSRGEKTASLAASQPVRGLDRVRFVRPGAAKSSVDLESLTLAGQGALRSPRLSSLGVAMSSPISDGAWASVAF